MQNELWILNWQKRLLKKALKPCHKRQIVQEVSQQPQTGINRACRVLNLSKSVYYYQAGKENQPVEEALRQKAEQHPREGFWKVYVRLRKEGHLWNHKRVYRIYKAIGLKIRRKAKKPSTCPHSTAPANTEGIESHLVN